MASLISISDVEYQMAHVNDNQQPHINIAGILCLITAVFAVGLRLYSRYVARAGIGPDDITILVALFFTIAFIVLIFIEVQNGLGRHIIVAPSVVAFAKVCSLVQGLFHGPVSATSAKVVTL